MPTPRIVENLVAAGRIRPTVVVLVGNVPHSRAKELGGNPAFVAFVARELLPWLRRRYGLSTEPSRTVLAGSSLGGVASACAALQYPRLFGNVLGQSGAFIHPVPLGRKSSSTLMEQYAHAPRVPIRFYLDAGTHESETIPEMAESLLGSVRHLRDVLEARGYAVTYAEFEGGHDCVCWIGTLADGFVHLLGWS
ncbi:MAG: alpha/beta hydrolase-fold protein [Thermoplasmata archaeon]